MLAANRTLKVTGRISLLNSSIMTINLRSAGGVPSGTKWAKANSGCFAQDIIWWPAHKGSPRARVKLRCLDLVKTKGKSPMKLLIAIKPNRPTKTHLTPGAARGPKIDLNSKRTILKRTCKLVCLWLREDQNNPKPTAGARPKATQLNPKPKYLTGENTANKLVIN